MAELYCFCDKIEDELRSSLRLWNRNSLFRTEQRENLICSKRMVRNNSKRRQIWIRWAARCESQLSDFADRCRKETANSECVQIKRWGLWNERTNVMRICEIILKTNKNTRLWPCISQPSFSGSNFKGLKFSSRDETSSSYYTMANLHIKKIYLNFRIFEKVCIF